MEDGIKRHTSLLSDGVAANVDCTCRKSVRLVMSNLVGHPEGSGVAFEYLQIFESALHA